jgi:hypothetical protein
LRVGTRLANPDALLSRTDLRELGLERRAVDAVFRALPVIVLPGYRRPLVRVADYLGLIEHRRSTATESAEDTSEPAIRSRSRRSGSVSGAPVRLLEAPHGVQAARAGPACCVKRCSHVPHVGSR